MTKKLCSILLSLLLILSLFAGCSGGNSDTATTLPNGQTTDTASATGDKLSVVATIFPAYDFVEQIAGDKVSITMLMKPGGEVHSYSPTADDMLTISNSDLFISVGGESDEGWVGNTLESVNKADMPHITMLDCVTALEEEHKDGMEEDEHEEEAESVSEEEDEHEHELDEHVWTSPVNAIEIVKAIADQLITLDSANAAAYEANRDAYIEKLSAVDAQLREIAQTAKVKTLLFADRFPFRYFTEEYGFDYFAAFAGCSASADPSAETVSFLINKVKELKLPVIFIIEFSTGATAQTIREATGVEIATLTSCHNVSLEDFENGVTYIDLMNRNIETLKEVLDCDVIA